MKKVTVNGNDHELSPDRISARSHSQLMQDVVTAINELEVGTSPDGLELTSTDAAVNVITSASNDATTTASVAAMTFKNTVAHATNDLEYNFTRSDDTSLLKIDKEGDVTVAGSLTAAGVVSSSHILPSTNATLTLGADGSRWATVNTGNIACADTTRVTFQTNAAESHNIYKDASYGITANSIGHIFRTNATYATAGSRLVSFQNGTTQKAYIDPDGNYANLNVAGTAGSGTGISAVRTAQVRHVVHAVTVTEAALTAAATTETITLWTLPAKTRVLRVVVDVTAAFTGGGTTACTIEVGTTGATNTYLPWFVAHSGAVTKGLVEADLGASLVNSGAGTYAFPAWAGGPVLAKFDSATANVSEFTAGSATFYIECVSY